MGSFGNYVGATMGGEYDDSWVTNSNYPERQTLLGPDGKLIQLSDPSAPEDKNPYKPKSDLLGEVPNLTSDHTTNQEIEDALHGPEGWNWERRTFVQLRDEKNALKPASLETLATAWKEHGDTLKTDSESFKKSVGNAISGKWSGASADAAEAASQQVTKTSIYDFTPSSDALSKRLTALKGAFDSIQSRFPNTADAQLIDDGKFDKALLDQRVREFNSRYHLDGGGRLRNNSDGYVAASQAIDEMNRIKRSIQDYQLAVQLFRDTYNPTVQAVTANFPNLPAAPNMKYGPTGPGPSGGGGGTGGGGGGTGGGGGGGTGGGGGSKFGTPPIGTSDFKTPDTGKNKAISDYPLGKTDATSTDPSKTPIDGSQTSLPSSDPTQTAAQSLKSGLDAASQGLNSGLGAATQAAQQAAQAAQGAAGAAQKPISPSLREGALGLGDKPGAAKGAGGSGVGGGGVGGREAFARPMSQPAASASAGARPTVPAAATSAAGGMGAGMGAPGAGGGPAAGQRGGEAKEHKGNKALRTRKNGSDIVGDTDAVVPVLGGDSPPPAEDSQPAPARRRIPQRGAPWQPDSAVQSGAQRPAQDPGSATSDQLTNQ
jgi:hypothetical protein